ncbi:MAG: AhpC/TSA family protein [Gemmataceae bacterium]|nr:AhpC/TSA family protein [Gemmataceae bacterium]
MAAARDLFAARGCSILAVCQAQPDHLGAFLSRARWDVPVVSDPDRTAYRAFGLERTGRLTFFRPKVLAGYLRGLLRGYGLKKPVAGEDVRQLGGDFILDRAGGVVYEYRSADPADRPAVEELQEAIPGAPAS